MKNTNLDPNIICPLFGGYIVGVLGLFLIPFVWADNTKKKIKHSKGMQCHVYVTMLTL